MNATKTSQLLSPVELGSTRLKNRVVMAPPRAPRGWHGAPGMDSDAQVNGWKRIFDAVHTKGGHIFAQLWHPGRFSHISLTRGEAPVSASVDSEYWQNPSRLISTPSGWIQPSPHRAL